MLQAAVAFLGVLLIGLVLMLIVSPMIAGLLTLVFIIVLMALSLPFLILAAPWLIIGGLVWLIFF